MPLIVVGLLRLTLAEPEWRAGLETITADELESIVRFLASDEMEGRDTATLSNRISSRYLAHQFEMMGLDPVGEQNDYFQYLTLLRSRLVGTNRFEFRRSGSPLKEVGVLHEDFFPAVTSASGKVAAPLVFGGYGITSPEMNFDEYREIDAQGKVIVLLPGVPEDDSEGNRFSATIRADYGTEIYKLRNAQKHGAVGAIMIHNGERQGFSRAAQRTWPNEEEGGKFVAQFDIDQIRIPAVYCEEGKIYSLLEEGHISQLKEEIDQNWEARSRPLEGFEVTIETEIARNSNRIRNVLACIPGTDPELKSEVIIVSAHFDHVGMRAGKVYNGADDDASGTAGVLEIAEAFVESPTQQKRSVLFALWNGEEKGLFGSRYYAEKPPAALGKAVAVLQLDMIGRNQEVDDPEDWRFRGLEKQNAEENENSLHVVGYSHSDDLRHLTESLNELIALDLRFELDPHPLNIIRRSDHWPFLLSNVPSILLTTGFHPDYHTDGDTADKLNYPKMERVVRLTFLCARQLANAGDRPRLNASGSGL